MTQKTLILLIYLRYLRYPRIKILFNYLVFLPKT